MLIKNLEIFIQQIEVEIETIVSVADCYRETKFVKYKKTSWNCITITEFRTIHGQWMEGEIA